MFDKMRKCLDDFEAALKKNESELTREDEENLCYFHLRFAEAMLKECPEVDKVGRFIVVEKGLLDDVKIRFGK